MYYWDIISDGIYFWRKPKHSLFTKYFEFSRYFDFAYIHKDDLSVKSDIIRIKFNLSVSQMSANIDEVKKIMNVDENDYFKVEMRKLL